MNKKMYAVILLPFLALSSFAGTEADTFSIPAKDFQWSVAKQPSEKAGGLDAFLKVRDDVIEVDGKDIPARTYELKYHGGNTLTLEWKSEAPIDLQDVYHEMRFSFRVNPVVSLGKTIILRIGNNLGQWTYVPTKTIRPDGTWIVEWDCAHEIAWTHVIDLRKFDRICFQVKFDTRLEKPLPENAPAGMRPETEPLRNLSVTFGDILFTKNNHWNTPLLVTRDRKWHDWIRFIDNYKVDYSDSSAMLEPPKTGRLKDALPLAVNGEANAEIIVTKDRYGVIETTAKELQYWVKTISGATLPIREKPGAMAVKIHLNDPEILNRYPEDAAFLRDLKPHFGADGYLIKTEENDIYIAGIIPKGVMNGMYAFLENNTSIIFARDDAGFGTVYDTDPNLKVRWGDGREKPMTSFRGWRGAPAGWGARNRSNAPLPPLWGGRGEMVGLFSDYLPNEPPYQVWADGQYHKFGYYHSQVCLGHKTFETTIASMLRRIQTKLDNGEPVDSIEWGTADNWLVCTCEQCLQPITLPDGTVLKSTGESFKEHMGEQEKEFRCNQYYLFANRLAREIRKKYPSIRLQILAYFFMEPAPYFALEDNLQIIFAPLYSRPDFRNPVFAPTNAKIWNNRQGLLEKKCPLELYEYYFHTPGAEVMRAGIRDYADSGFEHVGSEIAIGRGVDGAGTRDFNGIEHWSFLRLCWNYEQTAESVNKYYLRRVYREAAPVMEKFYGLLKEEYYKGIRGQHGSEFTAWIEPAIFRKGYGELFVKDLRSALEKVKNPIARIHLGRFLRRYEAIYDAWFVRAGKKKLPPAPLNAMLIPEKEQTKMRDQIMQSWGNTPGMSHMFTTVEDKKRFVDVARFRFESKSMKNKTEASSLFHSKHMGEATRIPLVGEIVFKMRLRTPFHGLPFFGVWSKGKQEYANPQKHYKRIGKNLWEVRFLPTGEFVNLDDICGFKWMCTSELIDPKTGYLEFDIFDVMLVPPFNGEKGMDTKMLMNETIEL